ncbi:MULTISPECIES: DUF4124 domain-containing protein [unclassified Guyparkeria]|uniref:DUF4124 domain-containing protein n=1 Tax=unclassified Guyparkeria TaxID=2626246 RepID=UPI0007336575|nr:MULTISPECIES: DUF4124 domain-containing protein [unclassified Guyparkeria]KTG16594.1 hypothetical protein AUR63_00570 [Guyparkeria sp. XI15]OAE85628.1 hypothetical protein AWR35_00570 [Guyparkeria sp. WRN-7]
MPDVTGRNPRLLAWPLGLIALMGVVMPGSAAKVYQYTNSAGETVFTDEPVAGAKVHEVESAPVIPMEPVELPEPGSPESSQTTPDPSSGTSADTPSGAAAEPSPSPDASSEPAPYQHLAITEPVDGEVASRPHGSITIELAIQPGLQRDDRVFILVDGRPRVQESTGRRHLVNGLASGRHELVAQIRRNGDVLLESAPVRFQLITPAQ